MSRELVTWRGTPGVGDVMWALNCVHLHCAKNKVKVNLEFHWEHGEDHNHHFEDPETIIERCDYLHNFYERQEDVKIIHVFNADSRYKFWKFDDDVVLEPDGSKRIAAIDRRGKNRFYFESDAWNDSDGSSIPDNQWGFRKSAFKKINKKKVVIWRPTFNAEVPRTWKRHLTNAQWDDIISMLRGQGLNVVELTYRTPVREAMYEISTCRQVICYDGMWHYIAKNFARPMAVVSNEGVTKYHTPHAIRMNPLGEVKYDVWWWMSHMTQLLGHSRKKAMDWESVLGEVYKYDR
ncbi:hypothetical protein OAS42_00240 [bacterium]|nr:hypothetical protein [bacterium]